MESTVIREIHPHDNNSIAEVIRKVIVEIGVPKVGTAYADKALDNMYEKYNVPKAKYFVVEKDGKILGCAGIAQLENYEGNLCELQKMYFLKEARGKGLGMAMIQKCLDFALECGFEQCYLETMPYMKDAQKLYVKNGFEYIEGPIGNTGHYSCTVWMIKII